MTSISCDALALQRFPKTSAKQSRGNQVWERPGSSPPDSTQRNTSPRGSLTKPASRMSAQNEQRPPWVHHRRDEFESPSLRFPRVLSRRPKKAVSRLIISLCSERCCPWLTARASNSEVPRPAILYPYHPSFHRSRHRHRWKGNYCYVFADCEHPQKSMMPVQ